MPSPASRSATHTRAPAKEAVDLSAFAVSVRKLSREMLQVYRGVRTPLASDKDARLLVRTIDELERSAILLRGRVASSVPDSDRTVTSKAAQKSSSTLGAQSARSPQPLILDTMEVMVAKGQMLNPVEFQERMGWKTRQAVWEGRQRPPHFLPGVPRRALLSGVLRRSGLPAFAPGGREQDAG